MWHRNGQRGPDARCVAASSQQFQAILDWITAMEWRCGLRDLCSMCGAQRRKAAALGNGILRGAIEPEIFAAEPLLLRTEIVIAGWVTWEEASVSCKAWQVAWPKELHRGWSGGHAYPWRGRSKEILLSHPPLASSTPKQPRCHPEA
jgi:hypothetical protein